MSSANEFVLVGGVIRILRGFDSWCGETHIQKSCYVAKSLKKICFESQFVLYKHGPYSFDLSSALNIMRAQKIITVISREYGSTYKVDDNLWGALDRAAGDLFENSEKDIRDVCKHLAKKKVAELERVATAVYVCL